MPERKPRLTPFRMHARWLGSRGSPPGSAAAPIPFGHKKTGHIGLFLFDTIHANTYFSFRNPFSLV